MNRSPSDRTLNDLADAVADEFGAYRHSDDFNELSIVIDNSDREHSTLIVHIDREQAAELADRVEITVRRPSASATPAPTSTCLQPSTDPESNPHWL